MGVQWLIGRVLDSRPWGCGFKPHRRHCIVSLSKNINPSLVLVQPRKTCPFITERLLMGHKESNKQTITMKNNVDPGQRHFILFCSIQQLVNSVDPIQFASQFESMHCLHN